MNVAGQVLVMVDFSDMLKQFECQKHVQHFKLDTSAL